MNWYFTTLLLSMRCANSLECELPTKHSVISGQEGTSILLYLRHIPDSRSGTLVIMKWCRKQKN